MNETVVLYALPIRAGHEREVLNFAMGLGANPDAAGAVADEGITVESVFVDQGPDGARLFVYQRIPDPEHAQRSLLASTNPVNVEMRHLMETALDAPVVYPLAFDYLSPGQ
ncbi:MAG: hypothetical protein CL424_14120 [Acidimicrobiaceae bacterium]|nr:hypothetical protein [Acidimicrobiaceae bacterium]